jgi:uncharacterized membrane protein YvlD (DUF360 family)
MELDDSQVSSVKRGPHGVRGWLLWYCVISAIITPIFCLVLIPASDLRDTATLIRFGLYAFSVVAGINLWMVAAKAIPILRAYFISFGLFQIYSITFEIAAVDYPGRMHDVLQDIRGFGIAVVWALYFHNSDRVKNTYGENL